MKKTIHIVIAIVAALALTGCGIFFPSAKMRAAKNTPGFKAGFSDGCASATVYFKGKVINQPKNHTVDPVQQRATSDILFIK